MEGLKCPSFTFPDHSHRPGQQQRFAQGIDAGSIVAITLWHKGLERRQLAHLNDFVLLLLIELLSSGEYWYSG